jgi:hypothetical protein
LELSFERWIDVGFDRFQRFETRRRLPLAGRPPS